MSVNLDVAITPRGPQLVGSVSRSYATACNLWRAAHELHAIQPDRIVKLLRRHRGSAIELNAALDLFAHERNVSLTGIQEAATRLMQSFSVSLRETKDFAQWEWPF
jgi:hypothetical protein